MRPEFFRCLDATRLALGCFRGTLTIRCRSAGCVGVPRTVLTSRSTCRFFGPGHGLDNVLLTPEGSLGVLLYDAQDRNSALLAAAQARSMFWFYGGPQGILLVACQATADDPQNSFISLRSCARSCPACQ